MTTINGTGNDDTLLGGVTEIVQLAGAPSFTLADILIV